MGEIWLIARDGPAAGVEITVRDRLVIGREPGTGGFAVDDPGISREHVKVRVDGRTLVVEDLDSSNGTYVNGELISTPTRLSVGDVLQLGSSSLEVAIPGEETEVLASGPPTTAAAPPAPPRRAQPEPAPLPAQARDSGGFGWKAGAAAVLGPLSILLLLLGSGLLFYGALPVAVLAVALGSAGKRDADRGIGSRSLAVAGQVFGIIGTVLATVVVLVLIAVSVATDIASDNLSSLIDDVEAEIESEVDSRTP